MEAIRTFASNPFGFEPRPRFWREIGALPSVVSNDTIMRECVAAGLLLPPSEIFGVTSGYLPGPAVFERDIHRMPIPGLPERPSLEEITHNARTRVLSRFLSLITENGCPSPQKVATSLNLPVDAGPALITSLKTAGLITVHDSRILPSEKMEELLGRPGLVEEVTEKTQSFDRTFVNAFKAKRAEAERVFQDRSEPLRLIVSSHPDRTAHELFAIVTTMDSWLPEGTTKAIFTGWLDKLAQQGALRIARRRQGPVRIVALYSVVENEAETSAAGGDTTA